MRSGLKDVLAGLAFVGFGLAFAIGATSYQVGSPVNMGPGFVPLTLGLILTGLGVLIVVKAFIAGETGEIGRVPWRALVLLGGSILFFGLTVRGLGLVPSLFASTLLAGLSGRRTGIVWPVVVAAGLTLMSVLIFVVGLQLRLPLFGTWLRF